MTKRHAKGTQIRLDDLRQFLTDDDVELLREGDTLTDMRIQEIATKANLKLGSVKFALLAHHHEEAFRLVEGRSCTLPSSAQALLHKHRASIRRLSGNGEGN